AANPRILRRSLERPRLCHCFRHRRYVLLIPATAAVAKPKMLSPPVNRPCPRHGFLRCSVNLAVCRPGSKRTRLAKRCTNDVERVLADIDADYGGGSRASVTWRAPCLRCPLPAFTAGRAGAPPDHSISGLAAA